MKRKGFAFLIGCILSSLGVCADGDGKLFSIGFMTDTHVGETRESCSRVEGAYRIFRREGCEVIVNAGDIADHYFPKGYGHYRAISEETFPDRSKAPLELFAYANHDVNRYPYKPGENEFDGYAKVRECLGIRHAPYATVVHRGYPFVIVPQNLDVGRMDRLLAEATAAHPGKTVFVICHIPGRRTTCGTGAWGSNAIRETLDRYPHAVALTGHVHGSIRDPRQIWRGSHTCVNGGCLQEWQGKYVGISPMSKQEYGVFVIDVYPSHLGFRRFDVRTGLPFDELPRTSTERYRAQLWRMEDGAWRSYATKDVEYPFWDPVAAASFQPKADFDPAYFMPGGSYRMTLTPVDFDGRCGEMKVVKEGVAPEVAADGTVVFSSDDPMREMRFVYGLEPGKGQDVPVRNGFYDFSGANARLEFPEGTWRGAAGTRFRYTIEMTSEQPEWQSWTMVMRYPKNRTNGHCRISTVPGRPGRQRYVCDFTKRSAEQFFYLLLREGEAGRVRFDSVRVERLGGVSDVAIDLAKVSVEVAPSVPAKGRARLEKAVEELADHIALVCGERPKGGGVRFILGAPPKGEKPAGEFFSHVALRDGAVWFWGDDSGSARNPHHGTLLAVYQFLDEILGVRWIRPGREGISFRPLKTVTLPEGWSTRFTPPLEMTVLRHYMVDKGELAGWEEWNLRNRLLTKHKFPYRHSFGKWQERFLDSHPEYLGMDPHGKRGLPPRFANRVKLCLSNEAVVDQIVADWCAAGTNAYLNICPNDGSLGYCHCEKCRALDTDPPGEPFLKHKSDRYVNFWNRVAKKVLAIRPDATIVSYIYSYYRFPPRRERLEYPDHQLFGIVPALIDDYRADLEGWKRAGLKRFFMRPNYLCYNGDEPRGLERVMCEAFRYFYGNGAIAMDVDGGPRKSTEFERYALARQLAFPEMPFEKIAAEYYDSFGDRSAEKRRECEANRARGEKLLEKIAKDYHSRGADILDDTGLTGYFLRGTPKPTNRPLNEKSWRTSFDVPGLEGWKARDGFLRITDAEASFDKYAVEGVITEPSTIVLFRRVPVQPGKRYGVSFDAKFDETVTSVGLKAVVWADGGRQNLGRAVLKSPSKLWQEGKFTYQAPEGVTNVTFYVYAEGPAKGAKFLIDNVASERID